MNKIPKLLLLDLDGTLLDDYKNIPEKNKKAIIRLYETFGVIPVIATARPLEVAKYIASQGGAAFQNYIMATNGAILQDIKSGEYLINKSLSSDQVKALIDISETNGLEYEFMTTKCEVVDARYSYRRCIDPMYDNMGIPFNFQNNLPEYIEGIKEPIPLFSINGTLEELEKCHSKIISIPGLQISRPCIRTTPEKDETGNLKTLAYFDIMQQGVTKASAIEVLARRLGVSKEEIIAIGDGGNDIEMLQAAGLKIAMLNASNELKKVADIVTTVDNNAGGVGEVIDAIYRQLEVRLRKMKSGEYNKKSEPSTEEDGR